MQKVRTSDSSHELLHYNTGETVLKEGHGSSVIYILKSGNLGVYKGEQKIAELSDPGMIFGEMSSILGKPRTCSIKAEADTEVVVYRGGIFSIIKKFPSVTEKIIILLADRLDSLNEKYSVLQSKYEFLAKELQKAKNQLKELSGQTDKAAQPAAPQTPSSESQTLTGKSIKQTSDGDTLGRKYGDDSDVPFRRSF